MSLSVYSWRDRAPTSRHPLPSSNRYFADQGELLAAVRARAFGRLADINEEIAAATVGAAATVA